LAFFSEQGIATVLSTGDIVDGPGDPNRCISLLQDHNVLCVRGNHERWLLNNQTRHIPMAHTLEDLTPSSLDYLATLPVTRWIDIAGETILLCHGIDQQDMAKVWPGSDRMPAERNETLDHIIDEGRCQWLINGHLHFRTLLAFEGMTLLNAGTLTGSRWPGFMTLALESQQIDIYEFRDSKIEHLRQVSAAPEPIWKNTQSFDGQWDPLALASTLT
jgi:predicted phosphodiesterase